MSLPPIRSGPARRLLALCLGALAAGLCLAQAGSPLPAQPAGSAPQAVASAPRSPASRPGPTGGRASVRATRPQWRELMPAQQQALAPLAPQWESLSESQKRKWIAMSSNFPRMAPQEQAKLHSRMAEWVSLSPQERIQARLSFGETRKMPLDDRKAKWEAYQQLPDEEKRRLAASAPRPPTTAAAVKPVAPGKLAAVPEGQVPAPQPEGRTPRIAGTRQLDRHTLLPQPAAPHASEPAAARP